MAGNAFFWGVISAISLPIGAFLGMWLRPGRKINSVFMAFGGGALLFALTIELFGHVPHHVEHHGNTVIWVVFACAIIGGLIFSGLNQLLNNFGAFMRRTSSARSFLARIKSRHTRILVGQLSKIKLLTELPPELMVKLVQDIEQKTYSDGELIFRQGDDAHEMFFIVDGQVDIIHHGDHEPTHLATLDQYECFGELGILSGYPRSADAKAIGDVQVYAISQHDFEALLKKDQSVHDKIRELVSSRIEDLSSKTNTGIDDNWRKETLASLGEEDMTVTVTQQEIMQEGHNRSGGNAALAIWMGIFIDCIPESLVIGMLATSVSGISLAFIAGVFLANMPEAMSSSVSMRDNGLKLSTVYLMWGSITLVTGLGAALGAVIFPPDPQGGLYYFMVGIEALAAGAMLTMIAETMLPEAFEMGGSIVGLSTLSGFLAALLVKII